MAKVLTLTRMSVESTDNGTTKAMKVVYKVADSADSSLGKSGTYIHPTPDFTKTLDVLFAECVDGVKTQEGIS